MPPKDLRTFGLFALLLALATLLANAYFLNRAARSLEEALREGDRVRRVMALNDNVLASLLEAETGQRGFLLTGREEYLEPYRTAVRNLPGVMTQLDAAVSGRRDASRDTSELRQLLTDKFQELSQTIDLRRSGQVQPAIAMVLSGRGRQLMDRIRQISQDLQAGESARLATILDARQRIAREMRVFALLGSALLTLLVGGGFIAVRTGEAQREAMHVELGRAKDVLETTLYSIGDGVIATDSESRITFVNPVACELTGYSESQAHGKHLRDLFHIVNEYSSAEVGNPVARVLREGMVAGLANHTLLIAKDGRRIPIDDSAAPIRHKGRLIGVVLVFRDVSARRRAEQDAAYLAAIVQSSDDAMVGKSLEGIIQTWNTGAERVFGYRAEEIIGRPITDLVPPDRFHEETEILEKLRSGERVDHFQTVRLQKGGSLVDVSLTISPIRDREGEIIGASKVARDITRQKKAERQLRDSESKLRAYLESAAQGIITIDESGRIELVNAQAEEMFGYNLAELTGKQLELLVPERLREVHVNHRADYFTAPRARPMGAGMELAGVRKDGSEFPVEIALNFVSSPGGPVAIAFISDISERKRVEEQLRQVQKLESLGVLAGGIAHDFNNLLTGILGNASMSLSEIPPDSPAREWIEDVMAACEKAARLTSQMLAYAGKGRFVVQEINLSGLIRQTVPLIKAAVPSTVMLGLELDEHLSWILADSAQIQQLIMNIIINGAEAIPEGKPGMVTITTRLQELDELYIRSHSGSQIGELKPGPHVLFEVSDTGSGMDAATKARIFDPFFTTKFTGRGLGLAAVLGIVRGHRGSIRVISAPGHGTTFRVLFPAVGQPSEPKAPVQEQSPADLSGSGTILVVDDEEVIRKIAKQALEHYGYQVLLAEDGAQALEIFRRESDRIQCVILDMTMPVMAGEETLAQMRSLNTGIPVILSSGYSEAEAARRFEGKGLAGFLQKPYKAADLADLVRDVISRDGRK